MLVTYFIIFAGVCHTKSDRRGVALGFVPQKSEKKSLQFLDNLIKCGLPCFKENGEQQKDIPDNMNPTECCDCCTSNNTLYKDLVFSTNDCGECVKNFIYKGQIVPEVKKCIDEKNRQMNIKVELLQTGYECFECVEEDDAGKV